MFLEAADGLINLWFSGDPEDFVLIVKDAPLGLKSNR